MNEQERRDRTERLAECIRLGEDAYRQIYEPRTHTHPAGHMSDAKEFFGEAIGLAQSLGQWEHAKALSERLAEIKAVYRSQFAGADSWLPLESIGQPEMEPLAPEKPVSPEERAEQLRRIREDAALVTSICTNLTGTDFDFGVQSVTRVDGYIERLRRAALSTAARDELVAYLGAFLGEAIIARYGGAWAADKYGWHIRFDEENRAYPFSKTEKHFRFGAEDSILVFYRSIAAFWPA